MNKLLTRLGLVIAIALLPLLALSGCSNSGSGPSEADVTDETVFTPPEEEGSLVGTWSTETDGLTINRYFYGSGQMVTIIQDAEEETWCILSLWEEAEGKVTVTNQDLYEYDTESGKWVKADDASAYVVSSAEQKGDDTLLVTETLPNGVSSEAEYKREAADIQIPDDVGISLEINAFLIH